MRGQKCRQRELPARVYLEKPFALKTPRGLLLAFSGSRSKRANRQDSRSALCSRNTAFAAVVRAFLGYNPQAYGCQ
jgi:hypothetical protein